eukprot:3021287-Amphidinium_carterae.1
MTGKLRAQSVPLWSHSLLGRALPASPGIRRDIDMVRRLEKLDGSRVSRAGKLHVFAVPNSMALKVHDWQLENSSTTRTSGTTSAQGG